MPLVDIFSFHYYPQHKVDANGDFSGSGTKVLSSTNTASHIRETRMDFSRSLWDDSYTEPSWLTDAKLGGASNMILKRIQSSIDSYFPTVKIMIGEFDYGHDTDISHGIAMVDFLGVAGQYGVEIATHWDLSAYNGATYTNSAYQLFRNYDRDNSLYGSRAVFSAFDNPSDGSIWGSLNESGDELHLIVLNKDVNNELNFSINSNDFDYEYKFQELYALDNSSMNLINLSSDTIQISETAISGTMKPLTAYHLVLSRTSITTNISSNNEDPNQTKLFPNPTQGTVIIKGIKPGTNFEVYSISGQKELTGSYSEIGIDLSELYKGLYLIKIDDQVFKVIKE